jgi:Flp pilus assembly pilin Flp
LRRNQVSILRQLVGKVVRKEDGQTLVEYSLIISLIALTAVGGMAVLGGGVDGLYGLFEDVSDWLSGGGTT